MKKFRTMIAMVMAVVNLCLVSTSCSNDKDEPVIPAAKSIAGSYKGNVKCVVGKSESTFENIAFSLAAPNDATVDITIGAFGNPPMAVPEFTVKGVKVTGADGTYALSPTEFNGTTDAGKKYSGTLKGAFAQGKLTVEFSLNYGAMPMALICTFTGTKQK